MGKLWIKYHKPPIWECVIPSHYGDFWDGVFLFLLQYSLWLDTIHDFYRRTFAGSLGLWLRERRSLSLVAGLLRDPGLLSCLHRTLWFHCQWWQRFGHALWQRRGDAEHQHWWYMGWWKCRFGGKQIFIWCLFDAVWFSDAQGVSNPPRYHWFSREGSRARKDWESGWHMAHHGAVFPVFRTFPVTGGSHAAHPRWSTTV